MQILNPDPQPLPQSQADDLARFFQSPEYLTLRGVALSHIATDVANVGNSAINEAEGFMRSGAITEQARESIEKISRHSIFLKVLEEIRQGLLNKPAVVIAKAITIDPN